MNHARLRRVLAATATALVITAAPAAADVYDLPDPDNDAIAVTGGGISIGDFDIDLRNIRIDHQETNLAVTSTFSYTNADSWTDMQLKLDTNSDRIPDYTALWSKDAGVAGVLRNNPDGTTTVTCSTIGTGEVMGVNGTTTLTIPRTCMGSPAAVAVHTDVFWLGYNTYGDELDFVDSAPGLLTDNPTAFSPAVPAQQAVTVPSPTPPAQVPTTTTAPALKTSTTVAASLSAKIQRVGAKPAKVKVLVKATGSNPAGIIKVVRGSKALRTLTGRANKTYRVALPKTLPVGLHRLKVTFIPADSTLYSGSTSKVLRLRVAR